MSEASDRVRPGGPTRLKSLVSIAAAALWPPSCRPWSPCGPETAPGN